MFVYYRRERKKLFVWGTRYIDSSLQSKIKHYSIELRCRQTRLLHFYSSEKSRLVWCVQRQYSKIKTNQGNRKICCRAYFTIPPNDNAFHILKLHIENQTLARGSHHNHQHHHWHCDCHQTTIIYNSKTNWLHISWEYLCVSSWASWTNHSIIQSSSHVYLI